MQNGKELDLSNFPTLLRLAHDQVHVHETTGDETNCEPCAIERELRALLREEACACYHLSKDGFHDSRVVQKIADRWT